MTFSQLSCIQSHTTANSLRTVPSQTTGCLFALWVITDFQFFILSIVRGECSKPSSNFGNSPWFINAQWKLVLFWTYYVAFRTLRKRSSVSQEKRRKFLFIGSTFETPSIWQFRAKPGSSYYQTWHSSTCKQHTNRLCARGHSSLEMYYHQPKLTTHPVTSCVIVTPLITRGLSNTFHSNYTNQ